HGRQRRVPPLLKGHAGRGIISTGRVQVVPPVVTVRQRLLRQNAPFACEHKETGAPGRLPGSMHRSTLRRGAPSASAPRAPERPRNCPLSTLELWVTPSPLLLSPRVSSHWPCGLGGGFFCRPPTSTTGAAGHLLSIRDRRDFGIMVVTVVAIIGGGLLYAAYRAAVVIRS